MHFNLIPFFFFFNDTATTEIYTLSLHDALPIYLAEPLHLARRLAHEGLERDETLDGVADLVAVLVRRSEEHTSELQSRLHLVCRLLLEKKKKHARDSAPRSALTFLTCQDTRTDR